jgi:predicted DNA-binding transcriptional regulator AlpA
MEKNNVQLVSDDLDSLEKGEIFLNMRKVMKLKVETISKATGVKTATIYNGIKLAQLPSNLKELISSGQIPSSKVLTLIYSLGKKSPTFHKDLEKLMLTEIRDINQRKESGEYRKRVTLYDKVEQLKKLTSNSKKKNAAVINKLIGFIEEHENMEGILDI